jgi:hypothetical protein
MAQLEANKDIRVLSFEKNRGKGGAVIQVNREVAIKKWQRTMWWHSISSWATDGF